MTTLTERIGQDSITATARRRDAGAPSYTDGMDNMDWWNVTLRMEGRRLAIPFGMGYGHHGAEPTAYDVLSAVLSDASGVENSRDFGDWASEYGLDANSRKAERNYEAAVAQTGKLREFLGDHYDAYLWETEQD